MSPTPFDWNALGYLHVAGRHPVGVPTTTIESGTVTVRGIFVALAGTGLLVLTHRHLAGGRPINAEFYGPRGPDGTWPPTYHLSFRIGDPIPEDGVFVTMLDWPRSEEWYARRDRFLRWLCQWPRTATEFHRLCAPPHGCGAGGWHLACHADCRGRPAGGPSLWDNLCPVDAFCRRHPFQADALAARLLPGEPAQQGHGGPHVAVPTLALRHAATGVRLDVRVSALDVVGSAEQLLARLDTPLEARVYHDGHSDEFKDGCWVGVRGARLAALAATVFARRTDWPVLLDALTEHDAIGDLLETAFRAASTRGPVMTPVPGDAAPGGW